MVKKPSRAPTVQQIAVTQIMQDRNTSQFVGAPSKETPLIEAELTPNQVKMQKILQATPGAVPNGNYRSRSEGKRNDNRQSKLPRVTI